jgi:hypothetical protein
MSFDSFLSLSSLGCVEMIVERGMRIVQRRNQSVLPVFSSFPVDLQHQGHEHKLKTTCRKLLLGFAHSPNPCTRTRAKFPETKGIVPETQGTSHTFSKRHNKQKVQYSVGVS